MFHFRLFDQPTLILLLTNLGALAVLAAVGRYLRKRSETELDVQIVRVFNKNIVAWMIVCSVLAVALMSHWVVTVVFFWGVSFWAQREFITLTPTRPSDHRTLFWVLLLFPILQYVLVGMEWYELYTIVLPVYGSLFVAARIAFADDPERFLERIAKIQFGLLITVFALSHAPALLTLEQLRTYDSELGRWVLWNGANGGLLLYLVVIVQISDLIHFVVDRSFGKHIIAPRVNQIRTWEGLIVAAVLSGVAGIVIQLFLPVTPFYFLGSGFMAMIISVMGSSGGMTMSAIKRDRGVSTGGKLVQGHLGVLDRIASLCFAAPIFFHVTRYFLEQPVEPETSTPQQSLMDFTSWWV